MRASKMRLPSRWLAGLCGLLGLLVGSAASPSSLEAQLGIAARAGTLGIGGEAALQLGPRVALRGGVGLVTTKLTTSFDDVRVRLEFPDSWYNAGLDFYVNGSMRIGAGLLIRPEPPRVIGVLDGPVDIGGRTFTPSELGTLTGVLASEERAPYVLIGFGRHSARGFGLSIDFGAAFTGDPRASLSAEGGTYSDQADLEARLEQEARDFEQDMKAYLRIWPIVSLGLRLGFG